MKYEIITKQEVLEEPLSLDVFKSENKSEPNPNLKSYETGTLDLSNLRKSKFNSLISEIPEHNMLELNEKGITTYSVVTTQVIHIRKNK